MIGARRAPATALAVAIAALAVVAAATLPACVGAGDFHCARHEQCGAGGTCEADGRCSLTDARCASGRRYVHESGSASDACVTDACPDNPIRALAAGGGHACLLRANGAVFCWGRNDRGQLGDGTRTPRALGTRVPDLSARAIAAGAQHTCAVRDDGAVVCWGASDAGQLGDGGGASDRRSPVTVAGVSGARDVAAGDDFSCAALADGTVRCWGDHGQGQLGDGSPPAAGARPPVAAFALTGVRTLAAHARHVCALRDDETLWCWGSNAQGQLGNGGFAAQPAPARVQPLVAVTRVAAGALHTCAATRAEGLFCWGANATGQLGNDDPAPEPRPIAVAGVPDPIAVAAGTQHTCAVRRNGDTLCWGNNTAGQLGEGTMTALPRPVKVTGLPAAGAAVMAGATFSCGQTTDGALFCWGDNHHGQLGDGNQVLRPRAAPVLGVSGATALAAGGGHTCAIGVVAGAGAGAGAGVACWGANQGGQLGDTGDDRARPAPTRPPIEDADALAAGATHTCARTTAGALLCWGRGSDGQLGLGANRPLVDVPLPTVVMSAGVLTVAAGGRHTCAALESGGASCWGAGADGQLGDGTTINRRPTPAPVSTLDGAAAGERVTAVAAGAAHSCATLEGGAIRCWGAGADGQLGDGTTAMQPTPVTAALAGAPVPDGGAAAEAPAPAVAVTAGGAHTCALDGAGGVWCWGRGAALTPSSVPGLAGARAVTAGAAHTCAITAARTVLCWGANDEGQLGGGDTATAAGQVEVLGVDDADAVAAGAAHTCALRRRDGAVLCWGSNTAGQLGDGVRLTRSAAQLARLSCE